MRFSARWLLLPMLLGAVLLVWHGRGSGSGITADRERPPGSLKPVWIAAALATALLAAYTGYATYRERARTIAIAKAMTHGEPTRAPELLRRYGCGGCHTIGGVAGADGQVGGSLDGLRRRVFIAGVTRNTPEALISWIVAPQSYSAQTAMPRTGISREEARDVAAYLYTR